MTDYPADLRYTVEHEWIRRDGDLVRVGITAFAQEALGDIVFVTLPEPGTEVEAGSTCGEVESTKSVSDLYAPLSGTVVERNEGLDEAPESVNADPYGAGWMFTLRPSSPDDVEALLTAAEYEKTVS